MADRIVTQRLCDFCQADDVESLDATRYVLFGHEIDACKSHGKDLEALRAVVAELGRKLSGTPEPAAERVPCPVCSKSLMTTSLPGHVREQHGTSIAELRGEPREYECKTCHKLFAKPQGLAVHERRIHAA